MKKKLIIFTLLFILILATTSFCTTIYNDDMNYNMGMSNLMYSGLMSVLQAYALIVTVFSIISLVISLFKLLCNCLIFDMAGEKWWKAIIPIYNYVISYKIIGLSPWLLLIYILTIIPILNIIGGIAILVLSIVSQVKLAKAFGKGTGFALGLIFFNTIFLAILAFGDSKYILGDAKAADDLFGEFDSKKKKKSKDPNKDYIVVDSETGEEVDPRFYQPMDLTDYKPKSDFFKN